MPLWTNVDNANGVPLQSGATVNLTPTLTNADAMYGNTTADAFVTGQTIGVYGVDSTEIGISAFALTALTVNNHGTANSYVPGDLLTANNTGATFDAAATINVTATRVRTVVILAGHLGTGYANNDTVTVNNGTMSVNAVFTVTTGAANTSIASLALTTNGSFTVNPTNLANVDLKNVTVANSSANGAQATITMGVDTAAIVNPGSYTVQPTALTNNLPAPGAGANGQGATFALTFSGQSKGITHQGWHKRTVGSGGRAGRVHYECLVACHISGDGSDDTILPDS